MSIRIAGARAFNSAVLLAAVASAWPAAHARPIVIEESGTITPPPAWEYFGRYVALDADWALIQGDRYIPDDNAETGLRHDGAALLFRKASDRWAFAGVLGTIDAVDEWTRPGLAMKGGVAMVIEKSVRVFERTGAAWAESPLTIPTGRRPQGDDIEIDNGRILVPRISCEWDSDVYRKIAGSWSVEGGLEGHSNECGDNPPSALQDLDGNRAVVFNDRGIYNEAPVARLYRLSTTGVPGWEQFAELPAPTDTGVYGPHAALHGPYAAVSGSPESGTWLWRERNQNWGSPIGVLRPVDSFMQPGRLGATLLEHHGEYFFQRNFSHDRNAYVVNVFRVNGADIQHVAVLVGKSGASLGRSIDISGNRVIVSGRDHFSSGDNTVRIFELPANPQPGAVHQDDFEPPEAGADWQPTAGSAFSVVQSGTTRVYRQASVAGNAASFLPASESNDQSVQAEVTAHGFGSSQGWFGFATRQTDAGNHYYVTARSSGAIELKRMVNGAFITLASAKYPVAIGRKYRLRLESIGSAHRVYADDKLLLTAYDSALTHGRAGLIMYRTSADYDNVVISPSAFATVYAQNFADQQPGRWTTTGIGAWRAANGVYRQQSTADGARAITGAATDDVIVETRVRATSFAGADRWVGLLARYVDDQNYLYVSLRNSNKVSLRQLVNGQIQILGEQPLKIVPGTWYTLRLERIGGAVRVLVNDTLYISAGNVGPATGQVGLVTYKTAAEFDDFLSYQP